MTSFAAAKVSFGLFAASFLAASCGDGDSVSFVPIEPGDICIEGGFQVVVNGEARNVCTSNTPSKLERFERGEGGNPCLSSGIRVTTNVDGGELTSWICDAPNEDSLTNGGKFAFELAAGIFNAYNTSMAIMGFCPTLAAEEPVTGEPMTDEQIEAYEAKKVLLAGEFVNFKACAIPILATIPELDDLTLTSAECQMPTAHFDCVTQVTTEERIFQCDATMQEDLNACLDENSEEMLETCSDLDGLTQSQEFNLHIFQSTMQRALYTCMPQGLPV